MQPTGYLVWNNREQKLGNAHTINEEEGIVQVIVFDKQGKDMLMTYSLEDVKLYKYSEELDIHEKRLAESAMVKITGLSDADMGVIVQNNEDKWYILLYENINGQYTPENGLTIALNENNIKKHNIETFGHLELFKRYMQQQEK